MWQTLGEATVWLPSWLEALCEDTSPAYPQRLSLTQIQDLDSEH